ncbi:DUF1501 domain-containing protein [Tuwongella immobilis]|uniref:DUF1501 domain-containing protein n=1 Tax=Tuwongella immobilis TaxID=692036 RepID=A0A6C2YJ13_9BACT|nr:DUF1501 domain-containing protein [Tuwongella immobilis]VIP01538.1 hypothetical protein : Uncharacterized protein OS=Isosphaera pallida (strain ATCC 43644 / DSM 9630 / IS1B) GN=Isop_1706 PE=4 SV=1: DUF1501 [Tuwongella immobilis]VTR98706.1 hypothetical protein : Uncharacterized protein OS=Isosphaera pallida (strain ATCC 43644 / DSM 9630 / IS1B) GN=Isop_1706 PE=4 SV=1: DUF1501 [Tuwongella immobilis]
MLSILGKPDRMCDGVSRRSFLKIGAFSFGAANLTLADILRAEQFTGRTSSHKAVINIFLGGGPPHQDMFDLKPDAPAEIRGEFKPIATNVTGIQIGECFPRIARMMDKFAIIRSIVGARGGHDAIQCMSGWPGDSMRNMGGRPSLGAAVARLQGTVDPSVPPFVGLADRTAHGPWSDPGTPGFLGSSFAAFKPSGPDMANMLLSGVNKEQLGDRRQLLAGFDALNRSVDATGQIRAFDSVTERALNVLTSSKLLEALDLSKEDPRVRARYGDGKPYQYQYDGAPTVNDQLLMARRLVEAGVRVVTLSYGRWDSHGKNFDLVRDHGTKLDQGLSALVEDLEIRGMLNDVAVIAWGEFGRTPRINASAGRDHWPQVSCAIMAGGGLKTGQVVGSTNRLGEYAKDRPTTFGEVIATLYHTLGINPATATVNDPTGRPTHLVEDSAMRELI